MTLGFPPPPMNSVLVATEPLSIVLFSERNDSLNLGINFHKQLFRHTRQLAENIQLKLEGWISIHSSDFRSCFQPSRCTRGSCHRCRCADALCKDLRGKLHTSSKGHNSCCEKDAQYLDLVWKFCSSRIYLLKKYYLWSVLQATVSRAAPYIARGLG